MQRNSLSRYSELVEKEIHNLIEFYQKYPYYWRTEKDIHCYFYSALIMSSEFGKLFPGHNCISTKLLHNGFPTIKKNKSKQRSKRYEYDFAVLDPMTLTNIFEWDDFSMKNGETIKPLIAIEFSLNYGTKHMEEDFNKLTEEKNQLEKGYIIHLIRDDTLRGKTYLDLKRSIEEYDGNENVNVYCSIVFTPNQSEKNKKLFKFTEEDNNKIIWANYLSKKGWTSFPQTMLSHIFKEQNLEEERHE